MKVFKWAFLGAGGLAVAAIVAFAALGGGISQAEEPGQTGQAAAYEQALADKLGITIDQLHTAQKGALAEVLDAAVAAGRITPEQAEEIKQNPGMARHAMMGKAAGKVHNFAGNLMETAAGVIGISTDGLKTGLTDGQSLAQIAQAHGVSPEKLKAGLTAAIEDKLDAAVVANQLTQEQADRISAGLAQRLDTLINRTGGHGGEGLRQRQQP